MPAVGVNLTKGAVCTLITPGQSHLIHLPRISNTQFLTSIRTGDCPAWMTPALLQYVEEIYDDAVDNNGRKVVGPVETKEILTQIHESPFDGGHLRASKNLQKFRQYYRGYRHSDRKRHL